jgi:endonuclease YncB( thermonuclease family)
MLERAIACLLFLTVQASAAEFSLTVTNVIDGDTFDLSDGTRIRVCGIDAPEHDEAGFIEARAALEAIVGGKTVRCVQVDDGTVCDGRSKPTNNRRVVAQCYVDGNDIALPLVRNGFACDWVKFSGGHYSEPGSGKECPVP